jgi:hypothetical protein
MREFVSMNEFAFEPVVEVDPLVPVAPLPA